jgi:asparagine synthase (glutamine-hydrolysing)
MLSADGRYAVTFNGEIYNYQELRRELEAQGIAFRSTSDTEVLLHLYALHGEGALAKLRGMFAFAIWDKQTRELFFARDRLGKKPFYYTLDDGGFAFASELKALTSRTKPEVDWQAVRLFLGLQYVPSPMTGFVGIKSLEPGSCGRWKEGAVSIKAYDVVAWRPSFAGSTEDAAQEVRRLLEESVRLRMIADVPVGTFLSGGVDSSAVAALMARQSSSPIKTFTMGFPSFGFDERAEAAAFAARLGAEHHVFEATPEAALAIVDQLIAQYDAPYADSSAIPTWLLAQQTKQEVKAVMTGDGGDELFAGYRRYSYFAQAARFGRGPLAWLTVYGARLRSLVGRDPRWMRMADTLKGLQRSWGQGYGELFTGAYFGRDATKRLLQEEFCRNTDRSDATQFVADRYQETLGLQGAMDFDLRSYLPDCLNVKMDRATMAHGLEARSPFLDQELAHFVTTLPLQLLMEKGKQKSLLRRALSGLVPEEIFERPKRGFQVPLAEWFRGVLRPAFVERCLSESSPLLRICRRAEVQRYLDENDRGIDHGNRLWMLFSLATWLQRYA